jgi:tRNA-dihydrouridine synthase B
MSARVPPLKIGDVPIDPPLLQAPMAGFSDRPYRLLLRRIGGVGLTATEMLSARWFTHKYRGGEGDDPGERLDGLRDEPRPLAVQIWDNDPAALAETGGRLVEDYSVDVVDLNFGCPARDVADKARSGAYLLRFPERIGRIVAAVADACRPAPVTAKIRLGAARDAINAIDVAQTVESAGGAALTVHGRTAADGFRGRADWEEIARVKSALRRIPLIGNGDITTPAEAAAALRRYGVDGVMIGRGALGQPWLFDRAAAALRDEPVPPEPSLAEQKLLLAEHFRLAVEHFGESAAVVRMRRQACWYFRGHAGAKEFRRLMASAATVADFLAAVASLSGPGDKPAGLLPSDP